MECVKIIAVMVFAPFVTYFVVKLGRYGYLSANRLFAEQQKNHNHNPE